MPTALYLYNSRDHAAADFYKLVRRAFSAADWQVRADFDKALEGMSDSSAEALAAAIGKADVVIYVVGPIGPGVVQGTYEVGQVLEAQFAAVREGRQLRIVPVLIAGATAERIPVPLRSIAAQMDNTHRGGEDELHALYRAVIGGEMPELPDVEQKRPLSSEEDLEEFGTLVAHRAQKRGLTIFIGPYAASDVHGTFTPGDIGRDLLLRVSNMSFGKEPPGALLTHPWVAAAASRMLKPSYDDVWDILCKVIQDQPAIHSPLPLDESIAELAHAWGKVTARQTKAKASWNGLLLVTANLDFRLEKALWKKRVRFGRLRCSAKNVVTYERPQDGPGDPDFIEVLRLDPSTVAATASDQQLPELEPVLVLKLMDCAVTAASPPPLATLQHLHALRGKIVLPDQLPRHLQNAPFVMLGGGLLNPAVSLAFSMHFLPHFPQSESPDDKVARYIALHPWPGVGDEIRRFEKEVDMKRPRWPELFGLKRIDWNLLDLVSRLANDINDPVTSRQ